MSPIWKKAGAIMNGVKAQLKQMYLFLGISYICGCVICVVWAPDALLSLTLGIAVSAVNFYLTYISFIKLYKPALGARHVLLAGPLSKLLTIITGTIICYQLPVIFSIVPFLIGVCLYPAGYFCVAMKDYLVITK